MQKHIELFQSTLPIQGETSRLRKRSIPSASFQSTLPIQGETHLPFFLSLYFNPLSLYRERLYLYLEPFLPNHISIHSPYTGRDCRSSLLGNIRSEFQSTLPIQGETCQAWNRNPRTSYFNPLSLYRERRLGGSSEKAPQYFNPLSLYRERQFKETAILIAQLFQSTLPIQGETVT